MPKTWFSQVNAQSMQRESTPGCHAEAAKHADAVVNKIFLMMLLSSGHAQDMVSPK